MNKLKIFIIVGLVIALIVVVYVLFQLKQIVISTAGNVMESVQAELANIPEPDVPVVALEDTVTVPADGTIPTDEAAQITPEASLTPIADALPAEGITVAAAGVTPTQKEFAQTLGIDLTAISITPVMVGCAETKIGTDRLTVIMGGAIPTFGEGVSFIKCIQ